MDIIKAVLDRKWKTIKNTYFFSSYEELPQLFSDFKKYLGDTPELKTFIQASTKSGAIPNGFFEKDFNTTIIDGDPLGNSYSNNFHLFGRIYNSILNEIDMANLRSGNATENHRLLFDTEHSRLQIDKNEIKIRKFSDQYHTLRIIFENQSEIGKEWFFSEIAERVDNENKNDKRFYNAVYQIGLKLKTKGIEDFFITTRQSVKISEKYLS